MLAFGLTAAVVIVIPGPSVLFVVGRARAGGRRMALLTVVGNAFGEYVQVIAVAIGIGALAERSVLAFDALAANRCRTWFSDSPRRLELLGAGGGVAIAAVGVGLLAAGRRR